MAEEKIKLNIRAPTQQFEIEVDPKSSISQVKDVISEKVSAAKAQICLIFSGKILKDTETLESHKISDGMAIHLVVRQSAAPAQPSQSAPPATAGNMASPPSGVAPTSTSNATASPRPATTTSPQGLGMGGANMQGMAQQMMGNPDMMRQMMDNPVMQNILGNPDIMRSMLANNPQIQNIIERNPEVGHLLNDPEIMRQTMEMIRNPNMFQEMMRNHDLAIRNLQGIPGGEAALQRLYQDVQEPLLNSATGSLGGNPYVSRAGETDASSRSQRAGVENSEALPNPWGGSSGRTAAGTNESSAANPLSDMFGSSGMDSMMNQMMSNPDVMRSVMTPEVMGMVNQQISQNPQLIQQMMQSNPLVANNPQLAEQMRTQMPQLMTMMSNPNVAQAMGNPRVLEAIRQIQEGTETIRREAPELARMFFGLNVPVNPSNNAPSAASGGAGFANIGVSAAPGAGGLSPEMMNMMSSMMGGMNLGGAPSAQVQNPEEAYASQLEQLGNMGFNNRAQNIAALRATFGDLNAAVERLLNSPQ